MFGDCRLRGHPGVFLSHLIMVIAAVLGQHYGHPGIVAGPTSDWRCHVDLDPGCRLLPYISAGVEGMSHRGSSDGRYIPVSVKSKIARVFIPLTHFQLLQSGPKISFA